MHKLIQVAFAVSAMVSAAACTGQTVYRCGNTYSQTPCPDASTVKIDAPNASSSNLDAQIAEHKKKAFEKLPDNPPGAPVIEANKALCQQAILGTLKDPDSAKITNLSRHGNRNNYFGGKWVAGPAYSADVNAKNSYGGYVGTRYWSCVFTPDESTLLTAYQHS